MNNASVTELKSNFPQAIIQKLVENSETFQKRTEFSQAKYLKKKQKKYVGVARPRALTLGFSLVSSCLISLESYKMQIPSTSDHS